MVERPSVILQGCDTALGGRIANAGGGWDAGEPELMQVAREGGLRDIHAALPQQRPELVLALDETRFDEVVDRRVSLTFVGHGRRSLCRKGSPDAPGHRRPLTGGCCNNMHSIMHKLPVAVLGASGYAGQELCRLLERHPGFELRFAAAHSRVGDALQLAGRSLTMVGVDSVPVAEMGVVFSALPHGASAVWVGAAQRAGAKVIDLSSDLRPGQGTIAIPDLDAPYGLPELNRDAIRSAQVIANPGCYPTATLLGVLPLVARELLAPGAPIVVDAASGVSGAGNSPKLELLFGEVAEDFRPYGVGNTHRHLGEMRATLDALGADADLLFTPHLLPVMRGILASITVTLREPLADPGALYRTHYAVEPCVEVANAPPRLRDVVHRNVARIFATTPTHTRRPMLQVYVAIDNLVKGAAGQAIQNANLICSFDEMTGLPL
jgi:N-acetyl-gamma-glutamyl-phosphate reductase